MSGENEQRPQSIYEYVEGILGEWLRVNGCTFYSERAMLRAAPSNRRMCVCRVISDQHARYADNRPRAQVFRVQMDIMAPEEESGELVSRHESLESAMRSAGALPQGNYRMRFDEESALAYIQKDYKIIRRCS